MARNKGVTAIRQPKKAKQVSGNAPKLKKLAELKKVNKQIDKENKLIDKKFNSQNKLHKRANRLEQELGID